MAQRQLEVVLNDRVIGDLKEVSDIWGFDYRPEWMQDPEAFDLSPAIGRHQQEHLDGASKRPVQWYFDNLLPEEGMRALLSKEMDVPKTDAFGLLAALGQESAGSLVLREAGALPLEQGSKPPRAASGPYFWRRAGPGLGSICTRNVHPTPAQIS